mmetsp:Transcript_125214/g.401109  ORF Transcript_125214/g.401109 Transcript_125214/m.401109 type:complete len:463 (+) Transcript_125214:1294-2682(+)
MVRWFWKAPGSRRGMGTDRAATRDRSGIDFDLNRPGRLVAFAVGALQWWPKSCTADWEFSGDAQYRPPDWSLCLFLLPFAGDMLLAWQDSAAGDSFSFCESASSETPRRSLRLPARGRRRSGDGEPEDGATDTLPSKKKEVPCRSSKSRGLSAKGEAVVLLCSELENIPGARSGAPLARDTGDSDAAARCGGTDERAAVAAWGGPTGGWIEIVLEMDRESATPGDLHRIDLQASAAAAGSRAAAWSPAAVADAEPSSPLGDLHLCCGVSAAMTPKRPSRPRPPTLPPPPPRFAPQGRKLPGERGLAGSQALSPSASASEHMAASGAACISWCRPGDTFGTDTGETSGMAMPSLPPPPMASRSSLKSQSGEQAGGGRGTSGRTGGDLKPTSSSMLGKSAWQASDGRSSSSRESATPTKRAVSSAPVPGDTGAGAQSRCTKETRTTLRSASSQISTQLWPEDGR